MFCEIQSRLKHFTIWNDHNHNIVTGHTESYFTFIVMYIISKAYHSFYCFHASHGCYHASNDDFNDFSDHDDGMVIIIVAMMVMITMHRPHREKPNTHKFPSCFLPFQARKCAPINLPFNLKHCSSFSPSSPVLKKPNPTKNHPFTIRQYKQR